MNNSNIKLEIIPIDKLELDIENPRVARILEMYQNSVDESAMALALGAGSSNVDDGDATTFHSLRESIRTNEGIIHPIIVNEEDSGRLVVIEGNTRALIYKQFAEQGIAGDWHSIPAIIHSRLSEPEKDAIRLQAHLVGPRPWDPYSKAKYLDHLRNSEHLPFSQIVDYCGGRKKEVLDYLDAFSDMEKFYRPALDTDQDFDPTRFSAFVELQKSGIKEAISGAGFNESDFSEWVDKRLIYPLNTVRSLPRILKNSDAKEVFLKKGAREAQRLLDTPSADKVIKDATLEQLARELTRRVEQMPYAEMQRLRSSVTTDENIALCDARDMLIDLCKDIAKEE